MKVRQYAPGTQMSRHAHDHPSLCLVVDGSYHEAVRGREVAHAAGALLFCPAGEPHEQRFGSAGVRKIIWQPDTDTIDYLADRLSLADAPARRSPAFLAIGRRMLAEMRVADEFSPKAVEGLRHELVALFAREAAGGGEAAPRWLAIAEDYLRSHLDEPCSPERIGRVIGRSAIEVSRAFRLAHGETLASFHRGLRLRTAAAMLAESNVPLSEVALACGYYDQPHFTRSFRAAYGVTPTRFRAGR